MANFLPDKDLSSIAFTILGLLAEGARPENDLREELLSLGWVRQGKPSFASSNFRNLEEAGLVLSGKGPKVRYYQLTSAGYEVWSQYFDFCCTAINRWKQLRQSMESCDFVTLGARPPRTNRQILKQRPPTKHEKNLILEASEPDFRRIYEFAIRCKVRVVDLQNALIEKIDWDSSVVTLEDRSETGRLIDVVSVPFNESCGVILRESINGRTSGPIFLRDNGRPWKAEVLATSFRNSRKEAGVAEDVALSGRGGKVGYLAAMQSNEDEPGA